MQEILYRYVKCTHTLCAGQRGSRGRYSSPKIHRVERKLTYSIGKICLSPLQDYVDLLIASFSAKSQQLLLLYISELLIRKLCVYCNTFRWHTHNQRPGWENNPPTPPTTLNHNHNHPSQNPLGDTHANTHTNKQTNEDTNKQTQ